MTDARTRCNHSWHVPLFVRKNVRTTCSTANVKQITEFAFNIYLFICTNKLLQDAKRTRLKTSNLVSAYYSTYKFYLWARYQGIKYQKCLTLLYAQMASLQTLIHYLNRRPSLQWSVDVNGSDKHWYVALITELILLKSDLAVHIFTVRAL